MEEIIQTKFDGWALVEIMGHRRAAGQVTTEYIGTAAFLRIVTPEVPPTRYTLDKDAWLDGMRVYAGSIVESSRERAEILVGTGSIYAITPTTEEAILAYAPVTHKVIEMAERKMIADTQPEMEDESNESPF
jgi:hypothetical protein